MHAAGEAGPSNIEEPGQSRKKVRGGPAPTRPLPANVCKQVIATLAKQEKWVGWAFDGRKNLYTAEPFLALDQEHKFSVSLPTSAAVALP